ncbi:transposase domain-containing protein [Mesorhizobium montanum]|uniref:transposase domain-containing protein n=1 Tax=Mesorhizobium montanum TaxID=3072323 RepID=UPI003D3245B8
MTSKPVDLPSDLASAYMALLAERETLQAECDVAVADAGNWQVKAANAQAMLSDNEPLIAHLELRIERLKRDLYGQRSERTARLIEQLDLQLQDLATSASEYELAAAAAAAKTQKVRSFTRKRPVRKPWPENIERERVVIEPPTACGGSRLSKLGEDVTGTLEEILRRFKSLKRSGRNLRAGIARRSPSRRRHSMSRRAASSAHSCWRPSSSTSSVCTSRSTGRARESSERASTCRPRHWPFRLVTGPLPSCQSST